MACACAYPVPDPKQKPGPKRLVIRGTQASGGFYVQARQKLHRDRARFQGVNPDIQAGLRACALRSRRSCSFSAMRNSSPRGTGR